LGDEAAPGDSVEVWRCAGRVLDFAHEPKSSYERLVALTLKASTGSGGFSERAGQMEHLREHVHAPYAQGYLIHRPMP